MITKTTQETYDKLCDMLDNHDRVFYTRFGDGDFNIMNGERELLHEWSLKLAREIVESIRINDEEYLKGSMLNYPIESGMTKGVFAPHNDEYITKYTNWLLYNQKIPVDTIFESHIMFHYISIFKPELMIDFLDKYIRPKKKLFIGSVDKKKIERLVGTIDYYVQIPERGAYYSIDSWWADVLNYSKEVELVLPAAGMAGRVIQKRLWYENVNIHSIELGSIIDAAVKKNTRSWIDRIGDKIDRILI